MTQKPIDVLIFMPVGPGCRYDFIQDSLDAIWTYIPRERSAILLVNDSGKSDFRSAIQLGSNGLIYDIPQSAAGNAGTLGGLFIKQIDALRAATMQYDWRCALRLDDDALIIGPNPHLDALVRFDRDPTLGQLGAYHTRGDGTNKDKAMRGKGLSLLKHALRSAARTRFYTTYLVFGAMRRSVGGNYRLGDMCTGGSFFLSRAAYETMEEMVRGHEAEIAMAPLDDDLLFSIHTVSGGYSLADFSRPDVADHPLSINYRGLPMSLDSLVAAGKKVVHPIKDVTDPEFQGKVRAYFQVLRSTEP